ncbi:sugar transferase [Cyanobium sp. T1G-Tous]|uniref:sugar transferase n=1 Tax=Cyanobium sp. T1G-Tous TaxID=2823722 RepID=UPI0020CCCFDF|nr:sugar transferase [Cyanobium sp. T1G-Tous]MCP9804738.1 sugar transferase [Cyanobium sp. T1G-Tous]
MRLPWLRARLRLVVLAGWDLVMLLLAYAGIYQLRIGGWWGESSEAWGFALAWLVFSYLLGRYSRESPQRSVALRRLGLALAAAALLLLAVQLNSWLARVLMEATRFRGFLLPWLGLVVLGSLLGQTLLRRRSVVGLPWLLVASPAEQQVLERELAAAGRELAGVAISTAALGTQRPSELGVLLAARKRGLSCCALDSWCERQLQRLPPELFDPDALLVGEGFQLQPGCFIWRLKRFGDVLGAALLLLATAPLLLLAMLLIKLEDGGPLLYRQHRSGQYGSLIWLTKLRTMAVDAEASGIRWATPGDPRITRVGHWLRRWRIDELPQLVSVLSGEMSLIGPRPERPELEQQLEAQIPQYRLRHWLRPGLSGWAQVCFPYGASVADSRAKLSYDLYYLRNAGPLLDLLIAGMTLQLIVGGRGALACRSGHGG